MLCSAMVRTPLSKKSGWLFTIVTKAYHERLQLSTEIKKNRRIKIGGSQLLCHGTTDKLF